MSIPTDTQLIIKDAYAALDDDDLDLATLHATKLLELKHIRGFEIMALVMEKDERLTDAIKFLRQGISVLPEASPLWEMLGNMYSKAREYDKAETCFVTALACPSSDSASISYNMAVMLRHSGNSEQALMLASQINSPALAVKVNTLRVSLLNNLERYDDSKHLANVLISEIMALDELGDDDMKDLAQVHAELGRCHFLGAGDKQSAFESAWKSLEWERSDPTALWLVRELIGRKSAESHWLRIEVEGIWYFPLEQGKAPPKFRVLYDIVADNVDEAMMFGKHLEPREIRDSMKVKTVSDRGVQANLTQGLYWRSPYNFVLV